MYRAQSQVKMRGFFEGAVMKESKGRVNPVQMKEVLGKKLDALLPPQQ